jgi:hypothetical protein
MKLSVVAQLQRKVMVYFCIVPSAFLLFSSAPLVTLEECNSKPLGKPNINGVQTKTSDHEAYKRNYKEKRDGSAQLTPRAGCANH